MVGGSADALRAPEEAKQMRTEPPPHCKEHLPSFAGRRRHSPTTTAPDGADRAVEKPPAPPVAWMATAIIRAWEKGPRLATYGSPSVPSPLVTLSTTGSPSLVAGEVEASYSCDAGARGEAAGAWLLAGGWMGQRQG